MNYYEHHIGDFDQATAHLSACEDGIYSRLIRRYYASEKPLPADIPALQRLVRAHSREEKKAVQTILAEFFELGEDGYHQHRCDEGIALFRSKQAKARASAEARWGAPRQQSERNANASSDEDAPHMLQQCEGNAPRARPQSPVTNPQTPEEKEEGESVTVEPRLKRRSAPLQPDGVSPQVWADWQALRKAKKAPVTETVLEAAKTEAGKAGMSLEAFLRVWCARGSQGLQADWLKPTEKTGQPVDVFAGAR